MTPVTKFVRLSTILPTALLLPSCFGNDNVCEDSISPAGCAADESGDEGVSLLALRSQVQKRIQKDEKKHTSLAQERSSDEVRHSGKQLALARSGSVASVHGRARMAVAPK